MLLPLASLFMNSSTFETVLLYATTYNINIHSIDGKLVYNYNNSVVIQALNHKCRPNKLKENKWSFLPCTHDHSCSE